MRYIQDPVTLELVPADQYERPQVTTAAVWGDHQPYRSMATGEMISGRRQHREHLKQHRLIELGNEKPVQQAPRQDNRLRQDIINTVRSFS